MLAENKNTGPMARTKIFVYLILAGIGVLFLHSVVVRLYLSAELRPAGTWPEYTGLQRSSTNVSATQFRYQQGNIRWLPGSGATFLERAKEFGECLISERESGVFKLNAGVDPFQWMETTKKTRAVFNTQRPETPTSVDTLYLLKKSRQIYTLALARVDGKGTDDPASLSARNLIVQDYYTVAMEEKMCLEKRKHWPFPSSDFTCAPNQTVAVEPETISPDELNPWHISRSAHVPGSLELFSRGVDTGPYPHQFFVQVLHGAVVNNVGDVYAGGLKILPRGCHLKFRSPATAVPDKSNTSLLHDELFVISQFWSAGPFHNLCESLPRIAPYVDFLKANPEIKIHGLQVKGLTSKALELLGIDPKRMVSGLRRAKTLYLPQGIQCGNSNVHLIQLVSHKYRTALKNKFPAESLQRNSIVVIKRTKKRMLKQAKAIENMVKTMAEKNGFRYELFADNPVPPFEEIIKMFNRAVIVVAPHGAGLSNIQFSEPGTYVIEVACNPPNLCYQTLAYRLGHRYHGVMSRQGCGGGMEVSPEVIQDVLQIYIDRLKSGNDTQ